MIGVFYAAGKSPRTQRTNSIFCHNAVKGKPFWATMNDLTASDGSAR
jgi:hypothetical protein